MRLRTILSLIFAVLLVVTDGVIGWISYSGSRHVLKNLTEQQFALANDSTAHELGNFLDDPASRLLQELTVRASRGMLSLNDDDAFGQNIAERLRVNNDLAWISYSDAATGHFIGVWRQLSDNAIILNRSSPGKGPGHEEVIAADGRETEFHRAKPEPPNYDPRVYPWFINAMATTTTAWSPPYHFVEGDVGVTASRSWRPAGSNTPKGVFTVDFHLDDLQRLLDALTQHTNGFSCVLDADGKFFCAARNDNSTALAAALGDWVRAHPDFKDINGMATSQLVPVLSGGQNYFAALERVKTASGFRCIVASMAPESVIYAKANKTATQTALVTIAGLALAVVIGWFLAHRISHPLHALGKDLAQVGQFHLGPEKMCRSVIEEVNQLRDAADLMKSGLRSFMRYVPDDVVRQLLACGKEAELGGDVRRLTLFFSDIEGFTTHSEQVTPQVLVQELSHYFDILSRTLRKHSGTIDKFIGDGMLGFFNAPSEVPGHERLACVATLEALRELIEYQRETGLTAFHTRVGLHCGNVLVGNIGTPDRFAYTVLGDVVNVASRLEDLNKIYGTQIIASEEVRHHAGDGFEWRHLDRIAVAGRKGQTDIFELLGARGEVAAEVLQQRDIYVQALEIYFTRSFIQARKSFSQVLQKRPDDKAAQLMMVRCDHMMTIELPDNWDGVFSYTVK